MSRSPRSARAFAARGATGEAASVFVVRAAEALAIYHDAPGSEARLAERGIDYVVIGPHERKDLGANEAAFKARYPVAIQVGPYTVYDVRGAHG